MRPETGKITERWEQTGRKGGRSAELPQKPLETAENVKMAQMARNAHGRSILNLNVGGPLQSPGQSFAG